MKVVVSIGGSVLAPDLDSDRVEAYARTLDQLHEADHDVGVVVGGGSAAREYIDTARELDANEVELDQLGIAVTRLNARLLISALDERSVPVPPTTYETAYEAFRRGDIPVMGGTEAGHTTDAVATALAEYADADLLVYATSVPGVFDADPNHDEEATKFDTLTAAELTSLVGKLERSAGSKAPVDLLAAKLLQRSGLRALVLDGTEPDRVRRAVEGDHDGTDIRPEDA